MKTVIFLSLVLSSMAMKYPNEVEEVPTVVCEQEQIVVRIKTTSSNPSLIYIDDFGDDDNCTVQNKNSISIAHGSCGMSTERTTDPMGAVHRVCVNVQLHPMFVTEADRSYCVQCVYVEQHILNNFEQSINIQEETATEMKPQFDFHSVPKCSYSIRKGSPTGPLAHYAVIGDSVFHVWKCDGTSHGILVQNCYVEDGQGNRIMIIDHEGCGVDRYVMETPHYRQDANSAFQAFTHFDRGKDPIQETHVFKFAHKTVTRFACQIRICVHGEDCDKMAPPQSCPSKDGQDMGVEENKLMDEEYEGGYRARAAKTKSVSPISFSANSSVGSVLEGRKRRSISPSSSPSKFSMGNSFPEMEVVGELRVLDSPDDVSYYEHSMAAPKEDACVSGPIYTLILCSLVLLSALLFLVVLSLVIRNSHSRKRSLHFPH